MKYINTSTKVIGIAGKNILPDQSVELDDAAAALPAVKTYLRLGFISRDPVEERAEMEDRIRAEAEEKLRAEAEEKAKAEAEAKAKADADAKAKAEADAKAKAKAEAEAKAKAEADKKAAEGK